MSGCRFRARRLWVATVLVSLAIPQSRAADPFYLGRWKIESATVAPWWTDAAKPDDAEMKSLVGKSVTISAKSIAGPRQLACNGPKYEVKDYTADMLFQGGFGEMQTRDKSVDPAKIAARLGFTGTSWKTLETGCGNEIDFHFIEPGRAAFGLNNYIYTLKKRVPEALR